MTELDKKVSDLFMSMIKSWDKIKNIENGSIEFDNGLKIYARKKDSRDIEPRENLPLKLDGNTFTFNFLGIMGWRIANPDTDKLLFYIDTPYRQYKVPEHDRHEYVKVLDILDNGIKKFEEKKINEYLNYYESYEIETNF